MPESVLSLESEPALSSPDARVGKYLIFRLGHGEFGTAINKVREVMEMQSITRVPNSPAFIAGVMNLRGKVIPVVDLRLALELPAEPHTPQTSIVIARVTLASIEQVLGIIVDAVTEVAHLQGTEFLQPDELLPVSASGLRDPALYLLGVARVGDKVMLLLDLDEVLNNLDLRQVPVLTAAA